jgi:hypothetical protein
MRAFFVLLIAAAVHAPVIANSSPIKLVGKSLSSLPASCKEKEFGILVEDDEFGYTNMVCSGQHIVTLERRIGRRGKHAEWLIVDQMYLPPLPRGYEVMSPLFCSNSLYKNDIVMAIGRWKKVKDGSEARPITHAWRFDLLMEKIESIPTRGIECSVDDP